MTLRGRARTAETYIAGLGASGALVAGAIVAFLLLVGAVTFDAWPRAGGLFGSDTGVETVNADEPADTAAATLGSAADQVTVADSASPVTAGGRGGAGSNGDTGGGSTGGAGGSETGSGGGSTGGGGGSTGGGGGGSDTGSGGNTGGGGSPVGDSVNDTVNGVGNTVDNTVNGLGNSVNDTVNGVGGAVNGLLGPKN